MPSFSVQPLISSLPVYMTVQSEILSWPLVLLLFPGVQVKFVAKLLDHPPISLLPVHMTMQSEILSWPLVVFLFLGVKVKFVAKLLDFSLNLPLNLHCPTGRKIVLFAYALRVVIAQQCVIVHRV